ncbi:MAG TPA: TonB-dependent receptor [Opitutales bacterium]|nr:TonB-dependent receptor [Opitutales bacterium]
MKPNFLKPTAAMLLLLLCGSSLQAIKITIPEQYEEQVEAIKQAQKAKVQRQLESADGAEGTGQGQNDGGMDFSAGQQAQGDNGGEGVEASEPLVQSIAEATDTAGEFEQNLPEGQGLVSGQIVDKETGQPIPGVAILIDGTEIGTVTGSDGRYTLGPAPAGEYTINFFKSGYLEGNVTEFAVAAGEVSVFPFALPPRPTETSDDVLVLDSFTVTAQEANQMMMNLDIRMSSDKMLNLFSAEDFSKFAASDVADALKRVSGVNIVEGQFAVIRGLEDRYSSTTYNGAPVPSPDPDSQSVQLDLFPSDVVTNLEVAKTFAGDLPSNSSGGSINIVTHDYPDGELEIKVKAGTGFEENAADRFLEFQEGSPIGKEAGTSDVIESDFSVFVGGRREWKEREVRFKALAGNEIDYGTEIGTVEQRAANPQFKPLIIFFGPPRNGDLAKEQLNQSGGRFDQTKSAREEQTTAYVGFGFDLDKDGRHKIDGSYFYTDKSDEVVQLRENGRIPNTPIGSYFDPVSDSDPQLRYNSGSSPAANSKAGSFVIPGTWLFDNVREETLDPSAPGHGFYAPTFETLSQLRERDLEVFQVNGEHQLTEDETLSLTWALNKAETTQSEETARMKYVYDFDTGSDPLTKSLLTAAGDPLTALEILTVEQVAELEEALIAAGQDVDAVFRANDIAMNNVDVRETQDFGRVDFHFKQEISERLEVSADTGFYFEKAERSVQAEFLESPTIGGIGQNIDNVGSESPGGLWEAILSGLDRNGSQLSGTRSSTNESLRDITAFNFKTKLEVSKKWELLGGVRVEQILLTSDNEPFFDDGGIFKSFPNLTVLESVLGEPLNSIKDPGNPIPNLPESEIRELVDGRIESDEFLPSLGVNYRPVDGLIFRLAWSKTVARPSFREMGFYATVEPGTSDLVVGNPSLQLSDVESWDARAEYTWGDKGDLVALSLFKKDILNPIEKFTFRDRQNFEEAQLINSFFNNPTTADLKGIEFEFQKDLGFILEDSWLKYFSFGGNFTYIEAEVERSARELANTDRFFDVGGKQSLGDTRQLFGQPEWIANLNVTFDQPDWGTKVTLAWFAISDVLNSAGVVSPAVNGDILTYTPDRYTGSLDQLDLVIRQKWKDWTFGLSIKNLTDTERSLVYDSDVVGGGIKEQSYRAGRDYSISASYSF